MIDGIESVNWTGRIEQVKEQPLMVIDVMLIIMKVLMR